MAGSYAGEIMGTFPTRAEEVTIAWLEERLREMNVLSRGRIEDLRWERIGTGQVGDSIRFSIRYDRDGDGPATLVGKFPSSDATSRQTAASLGLYTKETRFYREIRPLLAVRAPECFVAEVDASGAQFILMFEDLGPARIGNQLESCSLSEARAAIRQAAAIHAPSWNLPAVVDARWIHRSPEFIAQILEHYPRAHQIFHERYDGVLSAELARVSNELRDLATEFMLRKTRDNCFVHGDFRLDNMLFDIKAGSEPIAILDFQASHVGSGLVDIGFFLGCGVGSSLRRPHERELLELYCEEMSRRSVRLDVRDIWDDYCIGACQGLMQAVFSAAFVQRTERGDQNFLSMAAGAAELMFDHDSIGVLRSDTRRGG